MLIERFDAFFFDLDGVIYLAGQPLPGAVEVLRALAQRGKPVRFLTNDPRPDRNAIVRRLQAMGLPIGADQVFNVGYVTALWLRRRLGQGAPVHVVGSDGLRHELTQAGLVLSEKERPLAVVVGSDEGLCFRDIRRAVRFIRDGVPFIATNEDAVYPTPEGLVPGTGAVVKAVEVASGTRPQVIGKPARPMFDLAQESLGLPPEARIAMVGDNPLTDIAGAIQAGLAAIWVRRPVEGVHTVGLGAGDEPPLTPDYVVTRVGELLEDVPPYQPGRSQVRPARLEPWVAAIVTDAQERLLLVREAGGHRWVLPHGPLRAGEGIAEAAQRLVKEQAGCEAAVVRLGGVYADPRWNTTVSSDGRPLQLLTVAVCCRLAAPAHGMDGERPVPGGAVARLFASESLPSSLPALHARWIADAAAGGGGVIG